MIQLEVPWLPPSANNAYFNLSGGGRTLTTKGKRFKRETAAYLVQTYPQELRWFKKNVAYGLAVKFCFTDLENKTWPEKATTRYKKIDVSNRLKLLEDVLVEVGGIDDSQHMSIFMSERPGPAEHTTLWVWELEDAESALRAAANL